MIELCKNKCLGCTHDGYLCRQFTNLADKETPRKPLINWTGNEKQIICPRCKDYICFPEDVDGVVEKYRKHCGCCGQAIDWEV